MANDVVFRRNGGAAATGLCLALGFVVAAACSAGKGGPGHNNGPEGSGASSTGATSNGGSISVGANGGSTTIDPNDPDSGNPVLQPCTTTAECPAEEVCVLIEGTGLCSPQGPACTDGGGECINDTFCCMPMDGCTIDGVATPICVSNGARPVNNECKTGYTVGLFSPDLQCEWTAPPVGDPYPTSIHVLPSPLVANLPTESGTAAEIVIVTTDGTADATSGGRIRILNGQTCEQIEVIEAGPAVRDAATPSIADLDGDGTMEIVTRKNGPTGSNGGVIAFKFTGAAYDVMWEQPNITTGVKQSWDGLSIHDLNDDGAAELVGAGGEVLDGATGNVVAAVNPAIILGSDPVVADVDLDGTVDLVANKVFAWNGSGWTEKYPGLNITDALDAPAFYGVADFGTAGGTFDPTTKDGKAEVIGVGPVGGNEATGTVRIFTLEGQELLNLTMPPGASCYGGQALGERGGPPTVGDFDGDGMPELASAGAFAYRVFDLGCATQGNCADAARSILWESPTQDCTSGMTGSTMFDFEGDGAAEAVYADECFVRVYEGSTGEVLFSTYRNSATWWEQPIVADPDNSDRSKIIFGGAPLFNVYSGCGNSQAASNCESTAIVGDGCIDPLWAGVQCAANEDCISGSCVEGFCRCTTNAECGNTWMMPAGNYNDKPSGQACVPPLAGTPGTGNVCRALFGNITTIPEANKWFAGVKVYRDKLDRWASSRNLWNQHAYSITNINDDGTIPQTSTWVQNFSDPALNNFRQNRQGATSQDLADITGALDAASACVVTAEGQVKFTGRICNRGLRGIGSNMPAAFYIDEARMTPICTTQTDGPVPVGGCKNIECLIPQTEVPNNTPVSMVVNDAGGGARLVDECDYENNVAQVLVEECVVVK